MTPEQFIENLEKQIIESLKSHRQTLAQLNGVLRGIRIDVRMTTAGTVRAVLIHTEADLPVGGGAQKTSATKENA